MFMALRVSTVACILLASLYSDLPAAGVLAIAGVPFIAVVITVVGIPIVDVIVAGAASPPPPPTPPPMLLHVSLLF